MICPECHSTMNKVKGTHHYTESGLDNVILEDIPLYSCKCGNKFPLIPKTLDLHGLISALIIKNPKPLNGKELRFLRKELGFKAKDFAQLLGVTKITVSRWENESELIGISNDKLIRLIFIHEKEEEEDQHFQKALDYIASVKRKKDKATKGIKKASEIKIFATDIKRYKSFGASLVA